MYLWCSKCHHAHPRSDWKVLNYKYGMCPTCKSSEYRNAVDWSVIAAANNYPDHPDSSTTYPQHPLLF